MQWVAGKEFTEFIESQNNKMKRNIKMRVTLEQSIKIQEICFENGIIWTNKVRQLTNLHLPFLYICKKEGIYATLDIECYNSHTEYQEIDADLFIRTNGTCEENKYTMIDTIIHKPYNVAILEQKLKKKNEILKKARIKRKNQREELHKLNLKLQKCISFEEHHLKMKTILNEKHYLEKENKSLKESSKISCNMLHSQKDKIDRLELNYVTEQSRYKKEIEKLKAVIEYLESKVK